MRIKPCITCRIDVVREVVKVEDSTYNNSLAPEAHCIALPPNWLLPVCWRLRQNIFSVVVVRVGEGSSNFSYMGIVT